VVASDDRDVGAHDREARLKKRTYQAERVQLAAFGIARPEQGQLLDPDAEAPTSDKPRCVTCGAELEAGDQCSRCRDIGAEALTLETE
jgi:hypothetical protein